ncbi:MAG: LicD family protein [Bacteroidales bacterium]|nr:LicD family protein [Bacteroidales bacterium]
MERLTQKQKQKILLDIAIEVQNISKKHGFPFFMLGGTMLGAIRHKGFIPWDDDMDFGVMYENYFQLINILKKELPKRYNCLYYEDNSPVRTFFFKVEDSYTILDDPCINLPLNKKIGLSIDVFPIVSCDEKNAIKLAKIIKKILNKERLRTIPLNASIIKKITKKIINIFNFGNNLKEKRKIKKILDNIQKGNMCCNIVSPQFSNIIWEKEIFYNLDKYDFEGIKFLGPKDYNKYLSTCYKNYMQLPPEEKRKIHGNDVFFKSKI